MGSNGEKKAEQKSQAKLGSTDLGSIPYLELLLEFTVQPGQNCICLFVFANSSLNGLLLLRRLPLEKYKHFGEEGLRDLDPCSSNL
jgi:hypothetical protein